ncbi:LysR family transcriptional regulator, nitrogen assimilation regulatory protein [Cupriavidus metallidurans]|jgi:DNA-binding transcriptional LysR family regulator|uniref:Transcriptional regulator, LysR-family n=1 Tax=Cupriavidus metallidurans (strain ATCC 43123 / DSM 2839 / NBRC 102507 / CH34) TaxID=266264 RepID=Q1LHT8_CUPMC|nr:LysR family transcriptional regulator [Cupriavidus metallidurans]ABF10288.1 transcriptional regulator, LysR-family [Cupriavidus metallidurans CH34]KWW33589.1 HTH-type transcriptional regulator CynR [Cupriavidus metallidurans]MDE4919744.1 LysR family transcriptional regulator [Cupriavidus metallidurans]QGS28938.1 LysR family transcriptional regulator [Cupriavidus metallidurans]
MPVDLRAMQCFLAVAAAGSISRAAETLHIAQPALSLQIRHLEEALGVTLFMRSHKGVEPTVAGQRFEIHARDILKRLDIACEDVRDLMVDPEGSVAIGLPQSMAKILTVPIVREVIRRWPKVRLQVIELSTGYIPGHLLSGHIDIGLTFRAHANSGLQFDQIVDEDLVLVGPPGQFANGHTQAQPLADTVRLRDLNQYPMILPAGEHGLRALLDGYLRTQGVDLQILAEVNAIPELIALASAGVGCTVLSYASVCAEVRKGQLSAARICQPAVSRPVYLCRSATMPLSIAASAVLDLLTETVRTVLDDGSWPARIGEVAD